MSATEDYREGYEAGYRRGQGEREALAVHNGDLASEVRDLTRQLRRESIRRGVEQSHAGDVRPARDVLDELGISLDGDDT